MSRDALALILVLALSAAAALLTAPRRAVSAPPGDPGIVAPQDLAEQDVVPGDYRRIACLSSIAAEVLPELIAVDRVVAVSTWYAEQHPQAWRLAHAATIPSAASIEAILALHPDLVIINGYGARPEKAIRLREAGVRVLDIGEMRGWASLAPAITLLGEAVQRPALAAALRHALGRRLGQVAAHVPEARRQRGLYLAVHGGKLAGGTLGSSYHDLLRFAGLVDAAAAAGLRDWPQVSAEQVLALDPDWIVTEQGMLGDLQAIPGMASLPAIQAGRIVELPEGADTTGPMLLDCCERLCDRVYGALPLPGP